MNMVSLCYSDGILFRVTESLCIHSEREKSCYRLNHSCYTEYSISCSRELFLFQGEIHTHSINGNISQCNIGDTSGVGILDRNIIVFQKIAINGYFYFERFYFVM